MKWNNFANFNNWNPQLGVKEFLKAKKELKAASIKQAAKKQHWAFIPPIGGGFVEVAKPRETNPFKCPYVFIEKLKRRGFKQLGAGCFSTVLYKSGDRVIKVNRSPDAWLDYVKWAAEKGYAGGLAPKVYSYKKIGDFYVAIMEKIDYCAYKIEPSNDSYINTYLFEMAVKYKNKKAAALLEVVIPGAAAFTNGLRDYFAGHRLDLHNENIMFRADGSMVIIDPVSHQSEYTQKVIRLRARDFGFAAH